MEKNFSKRKYIVLCSAIFGSLHTYAEETSFGPIPSESESRVEGSVSAPTDFSSTSSSVLDISQQGSLGTGVSLTKKPFGSFSTEPGLKFSTVPTVKTDISFTDAYLNGDTSMYGIGIGRTNYASPLNFVSRPCRDRNGDVKSEIVMLSQSSDKINRTIVCSDDVKFSGYDDCSCVQYESCTKAVLGIDNFFGFKNTSLYQNLIQPYIGEGLGQRYAEKMIDKELKNIEEAKLLRKYAEKIGVNVPSAKDCEDQNLKGTCKPSEVDGIIYNKQKACGIASKINCYNIEDPEYKNIEIAEGSKEIRYDLFLDKITENKAVELITHELNVGNEIADLFVEKDKRKSAKGAMKLTLAQLKEKLNSFDKQKKLDPVLGHLLKNESKLAQFYNKMNELAKTHKTTSQSIFKDAISAYRKDFLTDYFSSSACSEKTSLNKICDMKVHIANASKNYVPLMSSSEITNMFNDDDFEKEFENYKANSMLKVIDNSNEFAAMIKGYRCFMLKYDFTKGKVKKPSSCGYYSNTPPAKEEDSIYALDSSSRSTSNSTENNSSGPDTSSIERDNSKINIGSLNIEGVKKEDTSLSDKIESASTIDLNKAMTETMNNNFGTSTTVPTTVTPDVHTGVDLPASVGSTATTEGKVEKSPAALLEERLRELTAKISAAEQSLEKVKSKKDDDGKPVKDSAQDEIAKSLEAQIKQLKSELASVKQKAVVVPEKVESVAARSIASSPASIVSSSRDSRDSSDDRRNFAAESPTKRESSRESARSGSDASSSGNSIAANAPVSSGTAQSRIGSLVLTKVDGLSSDAAIETISAKIAEMAGQPFLIEEGGFVKEIIPVVKDGKVVLDEKGKPVFEKIIKGKVADLKAKESKRAPASVSSQAELRRTEEAKVKAESDRLKYKNLRELTNEAVK